MAKIKKLQKISAKTIKKVKKTRKMIVEPFYVFGYQDGVKKFIMDSYHGSTFNNLVRLRRLLRNDKTVLWFAIDESLDELKNWERKIREVAKSSFNNDVEATVIDFQTFFANKQVPFLNLVNAALKLPKSKINDLLIAKISSTFELEFDDWSLQSYSKP
jgi:hypothetical protein